MGIFKSIGDQLKTQFIEVIEWTESNSDRLVYRFPVLGNEIKMGAQLIVRESQIAVFINEGQLADVFEPGHFELTTANMPIMTKLKSWKYGFNSPFKAEVYFINTKQFYDQKWGTSNPIMMRDNDFGMVRLRAFGSFAYRVFDPVAFIKEVLGTRGEIRTENITPQLTKQVVSAFSDLVAESGIAALDLARNYDEFSVECKTKLKPKFEAFGLEVTDLTIENISLPKEVEEAMDKRTQMGVLGDVNRYTQFQAADSISLAAQNEGGMAGIGASLAVGAQMASQINNAQNQAQQAQNQTVANNTATASKHCSNCGNSIAATAKFCPHCGHNLAPRSCKNCQQALPENAKFCPHCGSQQ